MIQHAATGIRPTTENPLAIGEIPRRLAQIETSLAELSSAAASALIARLGPVLGIPKEKACSDSPPLKSVDSTEYGQALSRIDVSAKLIQMNLAEALDRLEV